MTNDHIILCDTIITHRGNVWLPIIYILSAIRRAVTTFPITISCSCSELECFYNFRMLLISVGWLLDFNDSSEVKAINNNFSYSITQGTYLQGNNWKKLSQLILKWSNFLVQEAANDGSFEADLDYSITVGSILCKGYISDWSIADQLFKSETVLQQHQLLQQIPQNNLSLFFKWSSPLVAVGIMMAAKGGIQMRFRNEREDVGGLMSEENFRFHHGRLLLVF